MSYFSEVLADLPAGYWHMDESSGMPQDSSGNANNVTASFGSNIVYSQPGSLISNPSSTSIQGNEHSWRVPDHATLDLGDVFTMECWIRKTVDEMMYFFSKGTGAYSMGVFADNTLFLSRYGTSLELTSVATIASNTFYHTVATKNGATMALYINGVDAGGTPSNNTYTNTTTVLTLGEEGPDGGGGLGVIGRLDEMAVYPTALSAARVLAHYNAALVSPGAGDNPPIGILGRGAGW